MNEDFLTYIRNNCWKNSNADFVMMTDLDEVFYAKDIIAELKTLKEQDAAVIACKWYALIGDSVPEYDEKLLLHQQIGKGYLQHINHRQGQEAFGKLQLFNPKKVTSMTYSVGMHLAFPDAPITFNENIYQFHFDKGFGADYKIQKRRELWQRLGYEQKLKGYCLEYGWEESKIRDEYENNKRIAEDISQL